MSQADASESPAQAASLAEALINALSQGNMAEACQAADGFPQWSESDSQSTKSIAARAMAEVHMHRRNWPAAIEALSLALSEPMIAQDPAVVMRLRLAKNLADLQRFRPQVYNAIESSSANEIYSVKSVPGGLTIFRTEAGGGSLCLSAGGNPADGLRQAVASFERDLTSVTSFSLLGVGDGYLLSALAKKAVCHVLGARQAVYVIEPDARLLLHAMLIHDYSGAEGPIQKRCFEWYIGAGWREQFAAHFESQPMLRAPMMSVRPGLPMQHAADAMSEVFDQTNHSLAQAAERIDRYYEQMDGEEFAAIFRGRASRPGRALLITTRFSAVLQFSTADTAEALRQMGWETRVLIESEDHHSVTPRAIRRQLDEFRPDLVFQLDHLRHEYGPIYPPSLPFVCWIQDHLASLTNREAAATVTERDFILTAEGSRYVRMHKYPRRQVIPMSNVAPAPRLPAAWRSNGPEIIYTSNWSKPVAGIRQQTIAKLCDPRDRSGQWQAICDAMEAEYAAGRWLDCPFAVRNFIGGVLKTRGVAIADPKQMDCGVNILFDLLNQTLFRHQALRWTVEICKKHGLQLALFGNGWQGNPEFSPYAKGPLKPGPDYEAATRRAAISLNLEPYPCYNHPRLTTGILAGGFFLVRDNPYNRLPTILLDFLTAHFDVLPQSTEEARREVAREFRGELEAALSVCEFLGEQADAVSMIFDWHECGLLKPSKPAIPLLDQVSFSDAGQLEKLVVRHLGNTSVRHAIASTQRSDIAARLTYVVGMKRMLDSIADLISSEHTPKLPERRCA